ncbi:DUF2970 domain-containing protein [Allohahella marinimesophila]|uniref:DUF2970 domain-containing protein n=1 Tax=Allohahella marinimesophila TaxID=1054972 RepID=A0ABP7NKR0_9GAMM
MKSAETENRSSDDTVAGSKAEKQPEETSGLSMLSLIGSIFAAAFGVQSSKARERDFSQRSPLPFIIGGVLFGILFVVTLVVVVSMVLPD